LLLRFVECFRLCLLFLLIVGTDAHCQTKQLVWPSTGQISSPFGGRYGKFHSGIDITDNNGRSVRAADSGVVVYSRYKKHYGKTIIIEHENGLKTIYGHLAKLYVKRGMQVIQGQKIGKMGSSGRSTGIHLHFEVHKNGKLVNPLKHLEPR
jgi:murein DD-endopeptidase MepM/ murein hydrolase activator NlpD